eukprot:10301493-Karenia_brevis.AAC.1
MTNAEADNEVQEHAGMHEPQLDALQGEEQMPGGSQPSGAVATLEDSQPMDSIGVPARARLCPCGAAHLVPCTLTSPTECRQCGRQRRRGCRIWKCHICDRGLCPTCKEARPYWNGGSQESQTNQTEPTVQAALPMEIDEMPLLEILRSIPVHVTLKQPDVIPKRARKRMGRLAIILLDELLTSIAEDADAALLEEKTRALINLRMAILHVANDAAEPLQQDANITSNDQWKIVRRRLQLAEAG